MAEKIITLAELANTSGVRNAAKAITQAAQHSKPQFDLIVETRAEGALERPQGDAYKISPGGTTLTEYEQKKYAEIVQKFSETGDRTKLKSFTDALRSLNGEDEAIRTNISAALLTHGAKAGRKGSSLMAGVLVHVHGANEIEFIAHAPDGKKVELPIKELVKHGTLSDSGNIPKWEKDQQEYLDKRIQDTQESAKKLYPKEHIKAAPHR